MCWLSLVVRSPPARRSLSWIQSTVDWCMAPRKWGFDLKSNSTNYPDHGHHGDPPHTRKIPMVEPGIEPGTSWFVARSADHKTTRLVIYLFICIILKSVFQTTHSFTFIHMGKLDLTYGTSWCFHYIKWDCTILSLNVSNSVLASAKCLQISLFCMWNCTSL